MIMRHDSTLLFRGLNLFIFVGLCIFVILSNFSYKFIESLIVFECEGKRENVKIYLTHVLDLRVFNIEVLLKFWQLVQVPPLLAETLTRISKLHRWGSTPTAHGPKPWPGR